MIKKINEKNLNKKIKKYLEIEPEIKKSLDLFNISIEQYESAIRSVSECNTIATTKGTYYE